MIEVDSTLPIAPPYADRFGWTLLDYPSGKKFPPVKDWQQTPFRPSAELTALGPRNFGLLCGKPSGGTVALDFDAPVIDAEFRELFPELIGTRTHRTPGHNSRHYLFTIADSEHIPRSRAFSFETGQNLPDGKPETTSLADLKGEGGQVVLPGSIHPNGRSYTVESDIDPMVIEAGQLSEVCEWLQMECVKRDARKRKEAPTKPRVDFPPVGNDGRVVWDEFASAVAGLHESRAHDIDQWWRVGAAIHSVDQGAPGWQLFLEFSERCPAKFTEANCRSRWSRWDRGSGGISAATVFKWAREDGWKPEPMSRSAQAGGLNSHSSLISHSESSENQVPEAPFPDPADPAAFYGLAGDFVRLVEPETEADPMALLVQFLAAAGNLMGRTAHFRVEANRHFGNLFIALVGMSSKGRKGTSWSHVRNISEAVDAEWTRHRNPSGLASGEGLIFAVRDPIEKKQPFKEKGRIAGYEMAIVDQGVDDKRLLVQENELASALKVIQRQGNTLSATIRQAWETGNLETLTKNNPTRATDAHISIVGHITGEELRRNLDETEYANGFANRFLWIAVQRSKLLPEGGSVDQHALDMLAERLRAAIDFAKGLGSLDLDDTARQAWHKVYAALSGERPGLVGAVLSRAESQVRRLALIFAVLDQSTIVEIAHLKAALAVWEYCEASARWIFGHALGDPVADAIADALRGAGPAGLSRTEISGLFGRHAKAEDIARALAVLRRAGLASSRMEPTEGRPVERWFGSEPNCEKSESCEKREMPGSPIADATVAK